MTSRPLLRDVILCALVGYLIILPVGIWLILHLFRWLIVGGF